VKQTFEATRIEELYGDSAPLKALGSNHAKARDGKLASFCGIPPPIESSGIDTNAKRPSEL